MTIFGQVVLGPPGSGKTTYCRAMKEFLIALRRDVCLVNLDPANDVLPFTPDIDIFDLVSVEDVMEHKKLGPNGALIFCMEYLLENISWLEDQLKKQKKKYMLIDCPGQVELYTHHGAVAQLMEQLNKSLDFRPVAVNLVDSFYCTEPWKFVSALLCSLSSMLHLALPHINVLSKIDLMEKYNPLASSLETYTDVLDLNFLLEDLRNDPALSRFGALNSSIADILTNYNLVSFTPLDIQDRESMLRCTQQCDRACGYVFASKEEADLKSLLSVAVESELQSERLGLLNEKLASVGEESGASANGLSR